MACRNGDKARQARDKLESELDRSSLELLPLDLADLGSVRRAADVFLSTHARLDILVNNAGVMGTPYRLTADGFELQMATNHLGHFALTGLLLDRIVTTERSRVVTVSSHMHRIGRLQIDDVGQPVGPQHVGRLRHVEAGQPALHRRAEPAPGRRGLPTMAVAAHPGWTQSNLAGNGAALSDSRVRRKLGRAAGTTLGQTTAARSPARPLRRDLVRRPFGRVRRSGAACSASTARPCLTRPSRRARDAAAAAGLWSASEELTGVRYSVGAPV